MKMKEPTEAEKVKAFDRITRAKVQLQQKQPFFAHLVLHLRCEEFPKGYPTKLRTCGVDNDGNMYYDVGFINSLNDDEIEFVITHEVMHLALIHPFRKKNREHRIFNLSADLVVNNILTQNNFKPLKEALIPQNNSFTFKVENTNKELTVDDIHKKNAEIIYDEIFKFFKSLPRQKIGIRANGGMGSKKGDDLGDFESFDEHYFDGNGNGKGKLTIRDLEDLESKWKKATIIASEYSKMIGRVPAGLDRLIGDLMIDRVNWKSLLYKYITNTIPIDWTWSRPSKRCIAYNYNNPQEHPMILPSVKREEIEITAIVDTSGSVDDATLKEFVGEIISIAKSFNNLKLRLLSADTKVQADYEVANGNIDKIKNLNYKGGGGTNYNNPLKYVEEKYPNTKLVVYLGDGYCDGKVKDEFSFNLIWLLCKGGTDEYIKDSGMVMKIED